MEHVGQTMVMGRTVQELCTLPGVFSLVSAVRIHFRCYYPLDGPHISKFGPDFSCLLEFWAQMTKNSVCNFMVSCLKSSVPNFSCGRAF